METTETTPLLPHSPPPSPSRSTPRTTALTILSIATSTLGLLYTLPTSIWIKSCTNAPNFDWSTGECANYVFNLSIASAFSLALHIARHCKDPRGPFALFAFVTDLGIGTFGVATAAQGFQDLGYRPACPPGADVTWACRPTVVDVLLRAGLAVGIVLGVVHALFVLSALGGVVRKLRRGYRTWRFPTGQFTFEFTIKVLRQEEMGEGQGQALVREP